MAEVFLEKIYEYSSDIESFTDNFFSRNSEKFNGCEKILLKPNLLQSAPPEKAVTTHPEFLRFVIKSLRKCTDAKLLLADSPGANFENFGKILETSGIGQVCEEENICIYRVESFPPVKKNDFVYSGIVDEMDLIINLAKLKTHSLTGLTMCVKNFFGLIPGTSKVGYHRQYPNGIDLGSAVFGLYKLFAGKSLNLLDGIIAQEGEGPSRGQPVAAGILAAGIDAAAVDIAVTKILGFAPEFCTTNIQALEELSENNIKLIPELKFNITMEKPVAARRVYLPDFIKKYIAEKIYVKPEIIQKKCIKCLLCLKSCYADAITYDSGVVEINKDACKECFCCHEVCESDAIKLKRSIMHRIFVR
ncbi:MAG: DUF362 domain-containing protein [Flexistipes sinusarabici]|uniref:DUF362 domain-containing protein n=1 Tax=Flexistipes sinusarabici TaxID=2352 RepID=A0A5D0MRH2_FLESI|nr:DUF362 domain-containing protein [Flexistipes sinusarabici]TYB33499.1 MAG: DUF362 domain-containing protein [Flexistipes sinusarabici]